MEIKPRQRSPLHNFIAGESTSGVLLLVAAIAAMVLVNSSLGAGFLEILHWPFGELTVEEWINDGLMAVFFLLVGLEIKREIVDGQLSTLKQIALPGIAALGGMVVPALIYVVFNAGSPETLHGWAVPAATDIAFALAVLAMLGSRAPVSLKIFLTALAILDDLGAILIIALFYTSDLNLMALAGAGLMLFVLIVLNRLHVMRLVWYVVPAVALWWFVHQSGVHATIAGVAAAATIPARRWPRREDRPQSPLHVLEHGLHPWVTFLILPLFALANAGVPLGDLQPDAFTEPAPLGAALGLFFGKQIGVFASVWAAVRFGWAEQLQGANWLQIWGVSILCGIGFTMSLFINLLAFPGQLQVVEAVKLGVIAGSAASALLGAAVLFLAGRKHNAG